MYAWVYAHFDPSPALRMVYCLGSPTKLRSRCLLPLFSHYIPVLHDPASYSISSILYRPAPFKPTLSIRTRYVL